MSVDRITLSGQAYWQPKCTAKRQEQPVESPQAQGLPEEKRDICDISPQWEQAVDWNQKTKDYLEQLAGAYGKVDITVADVGEGGLQDYAASLGPGAHLIVSTDFLRKMASGAEAFQKGKVLLESLVRQLSGRGQDGTGAGVYVDEESATFWVAAHKEEQEDKPWDNKEDEYKSLIEMMEEMRKQAEARKERSCIRIGGAVYHSPTLAFNQLARATTVPGVKQAMALAEQNICTLKLAMALGPEREKSKIRATIAALQKVVIRGSGKIKDLNEEDDLRYRQKRAEQERMARRAEQIKYELNKKQAVRRVRECAQIMEGQAWFYYQEEVMRRKQIQPTEEELAEMDPSMVGISGPDVGGVPVECGAVEGGFAPCEVTVAPSVEISLG